MGSPEMRLPATARPLRLALGIAVEHDLRHLAPVRPFGLGVEQAQVRDEPALVLGRDGLRRGRLVVHLGVEFGRFSHGRVSCAGSKPKMG